MGDLVLFPGQYAITFDKNAADAATANDLALAAGDTSGFTAQANGTVTGSVKEGNALTMPTFVEPATSDNSKYFAGWKATLADNSTVEYVYDATASAWGWKVTAADSTVTNPTEYKPTEDLTFNAQWQDPYTVTFDANSQGELTAAPGTTSTTVSVDPRAWIATGARVLQTQLPNNDFTYTGTGTKVITGWYSDAACTAGNELVPYVDTTSTNATVLAGDTTYYAKWEEKYIVNFFTNVDASETPVPSPMPAQQIVEQNASIPAPTEIPERVGYTFDSWATTANGVAADGTTSTKVTFPYTVAANTDLYAQWTATPTDDNKPDDQPDPAKVAVTFDPNGGTGALPTLIEYTLGTAPGGAMPNEPTRTGYEFKGWGTSHNGGADNQLFTAATKIDKDYISKAETHDASGASNNPADYKMTVYAQWDVDPDLPAADKITVHFVPGTDPDNNAVTFTSPAPADITIAKGQAISAMEIPNDPTAADLGFVKWVLDDDSADYKVGYTYTGTDTEITVKATWTKSVNLTFDLNYPGADSTALPTYTNVDPDQVLVALADPAAWPTTATRPVPADPDYVFLGWNTAANGSGYTVGATSKGSDVGAGNVTLYAQWNYTGEPKYTVTFDGNGADAGTVSPLTITVKPGDSILTSNFPVPTRATYVFDGWYTDANATPANKIVATDYTPAGDVTLYAGWTADPDDTTEDITVTFLPGVMGTDAVTFDAPVADKTVAEGTAIAMSEVPAAPTGKLPSGDAVTFDKWYLADASGAATTTEYTAGYTPAAADKNADGKIHVVATWFTQVQITLDHNYTGAPTANTITAQPDEVLSAVAGWEAAPTRTDYAFKEWNTAADGTGTAVAGTEQAKDLGGAAVTLYAQWDYNGPDKLTVTFDKNDGDIDAVPTTKVIKHGDTLVNLPADPQKTGYDFKDWNTQQNGAGIKVEATTALDQTAISAIQGDATNGYTLTLYARWLEAGTKDPDVDPDNPDPDPATDWAVKFDENGGDAGTAKPDYIVLPTGQSLNDAYKGNGAAHMPNDPTRTDYDFKGWNTQTNGMGTAFDAATKFSDLAPDAGKTNETTVYAQWEPNQQSKDGDEDRTINFELNYTGAAPSPYHTLTYVIPAAGDYDATPYWPTDPANRMNAAGDEVEYAFQGWYLDQGGSGTAVDPAHLSDATLGFDTTTVPPTKEITLYAKWEYQGDDAITVKFVSVDLAGTSTELSTLTVPNDTTVDATMVPAGPAARGTGNDQYYVFYNWSAPADANSKSVYETGYVISDAAATDVAGVKTITVTAQWQLKLHFGYAAGGDSKVFNNADQTADFDIQAELGDGSKVALSAGIVAEGTDYTVTYDDGTAAAGARAAVTPHNAGTYTVTVTSLKADEIVIASYPSSTQPFTITGKPGFVRTTDTQVRSNDLAAELKTKLDGITQMVPAGVVNPDTSADYNAGLDTDEMTDLEDAWTYTFTRWTDANGDGVVDTGELGTPMDLTALLALGDGAYGTYQISVTFTDTNYTATMVGDAQVTIARSTQQVTFLYNTPADSKAVDAAGADAPQYSWHTEPVAGTKLADVVASGTGTFLTAAADTNTATTDPFQSANRVLNYKLDGWYVDLGGAGETQVASVDATTGAVTFDADYAVNSDITVTAKWTKSDDATLDDASVIIKRQPKPTDTDPAPAKETVTLDRDFDPDDHGDTPENGAYKATVPADTESVDFSGFRPSEPGSVITIVVNPGTATEQTIDGTATPGTPGAGADAIVLQPAVSGSTNRIEVTVTPPSGGTPITYVFEIMQLVEAKVTLGYGNSPYGMIARDTSIDQDAARTYFNENYRFDPSNKPALANANIRYTLHAWGDELTGTEVPVGTKEEDLQPGEYINYDKDETALFVYFKEDFVDPGFTLTDSRGNVVPVSATDKVKRTITVDVMSSGGNITYFTEGVQTGQEYTRDLVGAADESTVTDLTAINVRPGIYTIKYEYEDSYGATCSVVRTLVVLTHIGDIDMDTGITQGDISLLDTRGVRPLPDATTAGAEKHGRIFLYRIIDVDKDTGVTMGDISALDIRGVVDLIDFYVKMADLLK